MLSYWQYLILQLLIRLRTASVAVGLLQTGERMPVALLGHRSCPLRARVLQQVGWRAQDLAPWNCPCLAVVVALEAQLLELSVMALSVTSSAPARSLRLEPALECLWDSWHALAEPGCWAE